MYYLFCSDDEDACYDLGYRHDEDCDEDYDIYIDDDYDYDSDYEKKAHKLQSLMLKTYFSYDLGYSKSVYNFIRKGHAGGVRLEYDRSARIWELRVLESGNRWYTESCCSASLRGKKVPYDFMNDCLSFLHLDELTELAVHAKIITKQGGLCHAVTLHEGAN